MYQICLDFRNKHNYNSCIKNSVGVYKTKSEAYAVLESLAKNNGKPIIEDKLDIVFDENPVWNHYFIFDDTPDQEVRCCVFYV